MRSAPSQKALKAYRTSLKQLKQAQKSVNKAQKSANAIAEKLKKFKTVVIKSREDLMTVVELKRSTGGNWPVKVKVPSKYKAKGKSRPSEKKLAQLADSCGVDFLSRVF